MDRMNKFRTVIILVFLVTLSVYAFNEWRSLSQEGVELIANSDFSSFDEGAEKVPDRWRLGGMGNGSVSKEISSSGNGDYSVKIVQSSGDFIALYQDIPDSAKFKKTKYRFGCWVKTTSSGSVSLAMGDGNNTFFSNHHSGSGAWEYLTINGRVSPVAKNLRPHIWIKNNATAYVNRASLVSTHSNRFVEIAILFILIAIFSLLYLGFPTKFTSIASKSKEIPCLEMKRIPLGIFLILIMLLAVILRFTGLDWGIPNSVIPHIVFQCDEGHSMLAASHVDFNPEHIDLNTQNGHIEGSFSFYMYNAVAAGLKGLGILKKMPHEFAGVDDDYSTFLYAGRVISVVCDLLSILLIFLTLRAITHNDISALSGALLFAIIPFEVIHAHYMRTHTVANLFVVTMIYLSVFVYKRSDLRFYILLGIIAGFATATRYPIGLTVTIPIMMLLYKNIVLEKLVGTLSLESIGKIFHSAVDFRIFLMVAFLFFGFFIGDPTLFLDFGAAKPWLLTLKQYSATQEFVSQNLLNLSRIWDYLAYLIPYGTFPFLWIIFYFSSLYILFIDKYHRFTIPLTLFAVIYLYPMAKAYSEPIFIRAVMPLFPVFTILSAIVITQLLYIFNEKKLLFYSFVTVVSFICLSSIVYTFAYVIAMSKEDPRIQIFHHFNNAKMENELTIGITPRNSNIFLAQSTLLVLPNKKIHFVKTANFLDNALDMDYVLLVSNFWHDESAIRSIRMELTNSKNYFLERVFENRLLIFGIDVTYLTYFGDPPPDLQFPFPKLYLFKGENSVTGTS